MSSLLTVQTHLFDFEKINNIYYYSGQQYQEFECINCSYKIYKNIDSNFLCWYELGCISMMLHINLLKVINCNDNIIKKLLE